MVETTEGEKMRPPVKKRPSIPEQVGSDIVQGTKKIIEQGRIAGQRIKQGAGKIKKFMEGK
jgi:hypothetical protein